MNNADSDFYTYDEWRTEGRCVRKGEKSRKRDSGNRPLFHRSQTEPIQARSDPRTRTLDDIPRIDSFDYDDPDYPPPRGDRYDL